MISVSELSQLYTRVLSIRKYMYRLSNTDRQFDSFRVVYREHNIHVAKYYVSFTAISSLAGLISKWENRLTKLKKNNKNEN